MSRVRIIPALALFVGAALFLAACGGDDSPEVPIVVPTETTSSTGGDLTKDEFIEEADALCEEANTTIGEFVSNGEGFTASADIADIRAALVADIEDLGTPTDEDDPATLEEFLAGLQAQVDAGEKIGLANDRGEDTASFEAELDTAKGEASTAASTYGFTECGTDAAAVDPTTADGATSDSGGVVPAEPVAPAPVPVAPDTSGGSVPDTGDTGSSDGGVSPGGGISP